MDNDSIFLVNESISWKVAINSAFIGTYSHILLDSIMHADLQPFHPAQITNHLLGIVAIDTLHILCAIAGVVGLIFYFLVSYLSRQLENNKANY
jgi:membrane-bound metal-dependent hydrolase YbcI (DUF457 family)